MHKENQFQGIMRKYERNPFEIARDFCDKNTQHNCSSEFPFLKILSRLNSGIFGLFDLSDSNSYQVSQL